MSARSSALPLLVTEVGLSQAIAMNGNGQAALRVMSDGAWTDEDAGQVTSSVGTTADTTTTPTVIGLLKSIAAKLT